MPPLYDGFSYALKANHFWAAVHQRHWFNPLNVEGVMRPPGTVVFSYPLGWTPDFRTYYFNVIYFPIAIFVAALWLIGRPFCTNLADAGLLAALSATLATLPIFYHFEPNPQLADTINLGQMDAALAAVAALAAALTIRGVWELRLSWTLAGIAASAFSALIKPAGFVVIALLSVGWAVYTASRFCNRKIECRAVWKYVVKAGVCYVFCYGLFAFWCLNSRYLSRDTIEAAKAGQSLLQSEFGAPHLRELVSTTWALFNIAFGWQGLVLAIAICVAVIWSFFKRDTPKWHILWPGIITSALAIFGGGYFWLFVAGSPEIRYFFPFLAVALAGLFPVLLQLAQSVGKQRLWLLLTVLSLPLPLLTGLLLVRHPPVVLERLLRINLTSGAYVEEIQSAQALVHKARVEGRDLLLYLAGDDTIAGIFECVGMYESLIAPREKTFITSRPITWKGPRMFHLDELANSDYVLFTPIPDQPQVSRFLVQPLVADFSQELLVVRSWLTVAEPSTGLMLEKQMPRLRLYKVVDREKLRDALMTLLRSHRWRETFYATNGSKWFTGSERDTTPQANATPMSVTLTTGKSLTFNSANGFEGTQGLANVTMSRTGDGLRIHALNDDPQIILPTLEGVMPGNKVTVHVQLVSPDRTEFQIFYGTSAASEFDEAHSVRKPIQKGDNDVMVEFTEPDFKGRIRLDPGMLPGDYILKLVEVRTAP
jgi:hypothetical protein